MNGGKCGVCGDPWQGPRDYESGGQKFTGEITRHYKRGQTIDATFQITAYHWGFVDFRLCKNDDVTKAATWECMNKHVLSIVHHGYK